MPKKTLIRAKPNWQPSLEAGISFCTYIEGVYIDTYIYIYIYSLYIYTVYIYCIYIYCIYTVYIYIHMCIHMYKSQPTRTDPYSHGRLPNTSDSRGAWNDVASHGSPVAKFQFHSFQSREYFAMIVPCRNLWHVWKHHYTYIIIYIYIYITQINQEHTKSTS